MDPQIEQILNGYKTALDSYANTLGADHPQLKEARSALKNLEEKASEGAGLMELSTQPEFTGLGQMIAGLATAAPAGNAGATSGTEAGAGAVSSVPDQPPEFDDSQGPPPASVAAWGYHKAWEGLGAEGQNKMKPYYDRIFALEETSADALDFHIALAEDGVLLRMSVDPMVAESKKVLEQVEEVHSPPVVHHHQELGRIIPGVASEAELEFETNRLAELQNIEVEWDAAFLQIMGQLPTAISALENYGPGKDDINIRRVLRADEMNRQFLGLDYDALHANLRYWQFYQGVIWEKYAPEKKEKFGLSSANELQQHFFTYLEQCRQQYPPEDTAVAGKERRNLRFYDEELDVDEFGARYFHPPRPKIRGGA